MMTQKYWTIDDSVIALGNTTDTAKSTEAQQMANDKLAPAYSNIYSSMVELMNINVEEGNSLDNELNILGIILIIVVVVVLVIGFVTSMNLGKFIAKGISNPLLALKNRLAAFEKGDLSSKFPIVDSKDEVKDITDISSSMAATLKAIIVDCDYVLGEMADGNYAVKSADEDKYVGEFAGIIQAIHQMNHRMNDTLKQIHDASEQVSVGSTNLAQALAEGATDQSASVEELQATIANITAGIERTSKSTENSYHQASEYADRADQSREEMTAMINAMSKINETSKRIGTIISDIEDIASQTNLLSLNASI